MADTTRKNPGKKPSVTRHPLFPAVVVVWFAALFGLASLAIRPTLIESLVLATGIDHVIARAAPPLGATTRILIALLMTGLGSVVGLIVARRLATPALAPSTRRRRAAPAPEADTSPMTSFGRAAPIATADDENDQVEPMARRRRQLAVLDHDDSFEDPAPLPGTKVGPLPASNQILDVAELPLKSFDEVDGIWLHDSDDTTFRTGLRDEGAQEPHANGSTQEPPVVDAAPPESGNRLFDTYVRRLNAGVGSNDSDPTAPGFVSLSVNVDESGEDVSDETATDQPAPSLAEPAASTATYSNTAERIASAPLDALSHVELLERLAQTIARRRAQRAQANEPAIIIPEETPSVAVLPRVAAPQVVRPEGEVPVALRPHWAMAPQDEDEDAEALPAYVPARSIGAPKLAASAVPTPASPQEDDEILEEGYASLLGVSKATLDPAIDGAQPGRFSSPAERAAPAATTAPSGPRVFDAPQQGEPVPDQTEQALRAALATLRRMSGTA